jgi:hypothetical protein
MATINEPAKNLVRLKGLPRPHYGHLNLVREPHPSGLAHVVIILIDLLLAQDISGDLKAPKPFLSGLKLLGDRCNFGLSRSNAGVYAGQHRVVHGGCYKQIQSRCQMVL